MIIRHWRYNDGRDCVFDPKTFQMVKTDSIDEDVKGWHCWVWLRTSTLEDRFFNWLELHIRKGYDTCNRFNSGDPMTELYIKDDAEAEKFKEYWEEYFEQVGKTSF
jgi:hypothetical protein